jgi:predicted protein tyrosine phosphatase
VQPKSASKSNRGSPIYSTHPGFETLSAGTAPDAVTPLSSELIDWADIIFAMETIHRRKLEQQFKDSLLSKRIIVLGIPDKYRYMDPKLVELLRKKIAPFLPAS